MKLGAFAVQLSQKGVALQLALAPDLNAGPAHAVSCDVVHFWLVLEDVGVWEEMLADLEGICLCWEIIQHDAEKLDVLLGERHFLWSIKCATLD